MTHAAALAAAPQIEAEVEVEGPAPTPITVAVTGASGFVGRAACEALLRRGHVVVGLTRDPTHAPFDGPAIRWAGYDPLDAASCGSAVRGANAVLHLAGENLFAKRWRRAFMERIRSSRVDGTRALVAGIATQEPRPSVLVSASAVGYYGPHDPALEEEITEESRPGGDFLADVCRAWEAEADKAEAVGLRVVRLRLGVVLGRGGGALKTMARPFKWFVGGKVGNGRQGFSWIHRADLANLMVTALEDARYRGPVNATAPHPVSNKEFSKALCRALHRPCWLPVPRFALRLALGRVAEVLTTGQRVVPAAATRLGFRFRFHDAASALADVYRE